MLLVNTSQGQSRFHSEEFSMSYHLIDVMVIYIIIQWFKFTYFIIRCVFWYTCNFSTNNDKQKQSYSVTIKSKDNGNPSESFTKTFVFSVDDENEAPSDITVSVQILTDLDLYLLTTCLYWLLSQHVFTDYFHNMSLLITFSTCLYWLLSQHVFTGYFE
jgi:uncharacterized membrane protein